MNMTCLGLDPCRSSWMFWAKKVELCEPVAMVNHIFSADAADANLVSVYLTPHKRSICNKPKITSRA